MTPLFTAPQEMFFVILTLVLFAALVGDFCNARFFRSIRNRPSPWKDMTKGMRFFFFMLVTFFAWAQDKTNQMSRLTGGDSLSVSAIESVEGDDYRMTEESVDPQKLNPFGRSYSMMGGGSTEGASMITQTVLSGLPAFTSNAVLSASQYLGGFACVGVTNIQPSALDAPSNAVIYTDWPYAVARQAVPLPQGCLPDGFTFGGRAISNLYVSASGMISFDGPKSSQMPSANGIPDGTAANYIAVLQTPTDIVPTNGFFWYALGTDSSIFTWKDVFLGQDTNCLATVQAELYTNGNFTCRYYFPSPTNNYAMLTNFFLVGAQNNSGGETVLHTNALLAIHPSFLPAFELQWKAFGDLLTDAHAENDFDADGFFDFDELLFGIDPRRADTDGDGLKDGWEVRHGFDPTEAGATWDDPDSDGRPNIMESYMDTDPYISDGVPACLTADEEKTSITFTLAGSLAENAFAVLWFDGTALPFTATNTAWTVYFPVDALYEARFDVPEAYVEGLTISDANRMFLFDPSGVISSATPPAPSSRSESFQSSSSTLHSLGSGSFWMGYVDFSVSPLCSLVHRWDSYILFTAEPDSALSSLADGAFINWTATYGLISYSTGWVTAFSPSFDDNEYASVTVADVVAYSGSIEVNDTYISSTGKVDICNGHIALSLNATPNFSPHLGETNTIVITAAMHNCTHEVTPGEGCTFEIELMRETTSGWQHVAWLDADPGTAGSQEAFTITNGWQGTTLQWDGIATESAAQATSPDVFTQGTQPFNRIFPAVTSGNPLPPPFYTICTRIRKNDAIYAQASQTVYVPQVVKIEWDEDVVALLASPDYYPIPPDAPEVTIYSGTNTESIVSMLQSLPELVSSAYPSDVNIRFTAEDVASDSVKIARIMRKSLSGRDNGLGCSKNGRANFPNKDPFGVAEIYVTKMRDEIRLSCSAYISLTNSAKYISTIPVQSQQYLSFIANTVIHEIGHELGLVMPKILNSNTSDMHNSSSDPFAIMRWSTPTICSVQSTSGFLWLSLEDEYLNFILPIP